MTSEPVDWSALPKLGINVQISNAHGWGVHVMELSRRLMERGIALPVQVSAGSIMLALPPNEAKLFEPVAAAHAEFALRIWPRVSASARSRCFTREETSRLRGTALGHQAGPNRYAVSGVRGRTFRSRRRGVRPTVSHGHCGVTMERRVPAPSATMCTTAHLASTPHCLAPARAMTGLAKVDSSFFQAGRRSTARARIWSWQPSSAFSRSTPTPSL